MKKFILLALCLLLVTTSLSASGIVEVVSNDGLHGVNTMLNDLYSLEKNSLFTPEEKEDAVNRIMNGVPLKSIIREHNAKLEAERLVTPFFTTTFSYRGFISNVSISPTCASFSIYEGAKKEDIESLIEVLRHMYSDIEGVSLSIEDGNVIFTYDEYDEDILLAAYRVLERDLTAYIDEYYNDKLEKEAALITVVDEVFEDVTIDDYPAQSLDEDVYITEIGASSVNGYIEAYKDRTTITFTEGFDKVEEGKLINYIQNNGTTLFKTYSIEGNTYTFVYVTQEMVTVEREVELFKLLVVEYLNQNIGEKKSSFSFDFGLDAGVRSSLDFSAKEYKFYPLADVDMTLSWYFLYGRASLEGYATRSEEKLYFVGSVRLDGGLKYRIGIFEPYLFAGGRYIFSNNSEALMGLQFEYGGGLRLHLSSNLYINAEVQRYNETMYYNAVFGYKF